MVGSFKDNENIKNIFEEIKGEYDITINDTLFNLIENYVDKKLSSLSIEDAAKEIEMEDLVDYGFKREDVLAGSFSAIKNRIEDLKSKYPDTYKDELSKIMSDKQVDFFLNSKGRIDLKNMDFKEIFPLSVDYQKTDIREAIIPILKQKMTSDIVRDSKEEGRNPYTFKLSDIKDPIEKQISYAKGKQKTIDVEKHKEKGEIER